MGDISKGVANTLVARQKYAVYKTTIEVFAYLNLKGTQGQIRSAEFMTPIDSFAI
jgi:hypothetical protein